MMRLLILELFSKNNLNQISISKPNTIVIKNYFRVKWLLDKINKKKVKDFKTIYFRAKELNLLKCKYKITKINKSKMQKVNHMIEIEIFELSIIFIEPLKISLKVIMYLSIIFKY